MFNKFLSMFKKGERKQRTRQVAFGLMLAGATAALIAAFTLTVEKFHLYENPNAVLSCSINVVLNCSTVMQSWQSHVFGFPNMLIGMVAFPVLMTIAVLGLSGTKFPRWFLIAASVTLLLGLIFSYWLFFQSLYVIQVLCPWCLIVTASTTVAFSSFLHFNLKENTFKLKGEWNARVQSFLDSGFHQMIVLSWLALMVVLVFIKFGEALFA